MKNNRLKRHILVLATLTVAMVASVYGLRTFVQYLKQEVRVVTATYDRIASYEQNKKIFADERAAIDDLTKRISALEEYTITPATTPVLLSSLEELAVVHGVDFSITSVQNPGKQKSERLVIDFSSSGTQDAVNAFLEDILRQTYQLKFTKLSLFANPGTTNEWNVLGSIQVMSFGI